MAASLPAKSTVRLVKSWRLAPLACPWYSAVTVFALLLKALNHAEYSGNGNVAPEPVSRTLSCEITGVAEAIRTTTAAASEVRERVTLNLLSRQPIRGSRPPGNPPRIVRADDCVSATTTLRTRDDGVYRWITSGRRRGSGEVQRGPAPPPGPRRTPWPP